MAQSSIDAVRADSELVELATVVRRVVGARVRDPDTVDDAVQETLARVLEARPRLDDRALTPYAIVTAQNLVASLARGADRQQRNLPRLVDLREVELPEDEVVQQEEREAVAAALTKLPSRDRDAVLAHTIMGTDTATLASELESTPGGVAVRLARARATLRVEYLLAMYKGKPPTPRCRPVLVALSAGDRRRQLSLDAGAHLLDCSHCGALSDALMARRRTLEALLPLSLLGTSTSFFKGMLKAPGAKLLAAFKLPAVKVATALSGLVVGAVTFHGVFSDQPSPTAATCGTSRGVLIAKDQVQGWSDSSLSALRGTAVSGCRVRVLSVPTDEGFWVGRDRNTAVWVQLSGYGESPVDVDVGGLVSFTGRVVPQSPAFARKVGLRSGVALRREASHIAVEGDVEVIRRRSA